MAAFTRTVAVTALLCGIVLLGYWRLTFDQQARTIAELSGVNEQLKATIAKREAMLQRLSRSRRVAHLQVTGQETASDGRIQSTDVRFIELDDEGSELGERRFTVPGDVVFVDAWTVKFDPEVVAEGDPLRGRTLVLLKRIYSDRMKPEEGLPIDTPGAVPPGYATGDIGRFEKAVWDNFWSIATDAKRAADYGVRVAQGEAVYKPVRSGQTFELVVDAAGGMSLTPLSQAISQAGP